jgi:hypothetical protein
MPKNTYFIKENIPKIEEVREIENQIPTYEEFMKNYKGDELVESSYQAEHEAKISHGPQYGPGRSDFSGLCRRIKDDLGGDLTCRISCNSDSFYSWKNYAGVIVYAMNGNFRWVSSGGRASGRNGRSFYMIIKCTDNWGSDRIGIGSGIFHGSIIKDELGIDLSYNSNTVCGGGFVYRNGELKFNSHALNSVDQAVCSSDGSSELSYYEKRLVEHCFNEYKAKGPGSVISIPSYCLP